MKTRYKIQINIFIVILLNVILVLKLHCSEDLYSLGPIFVKNFTGLVTFEALSRTRMYSTTLQDNSLNDTSTVSLLRTSLNLNLAAYLWNPKIISFDIGGTYSPSINQNSYIVIPEMSEGVNQNRLHGNVSLLSFLPVNLTLFGDIGNVITKSDFGSETHSTFNGYGASSSFNNILIPLTFAYSKNTTNETNMLNNVNYYNYFEMMNATASRDLFGIMNNGFNATYQKIRTGYYSTNTYSSNNLDLGLFNSISGFDDFLQLNSDLFYTNSTGDFSYNRLNEVATMTLNLPYRFKLRTNYNYVVNNRDSIKSVVNMPRISLEHHLFSSLISHFYFEENKTTQSNNGVKIFEQTSNLYGFDFNYTKKIPTGDFSLGYTYRKNIQNSSSANSELNIRSEAYYIDDTKQSLLKYSKVIENSIVIKDSTGTLIYQINIDYILVLVNGYFQIIRVPSGRITDKSTVFIDYTTTLSGIYDYSMIYNSYSGGINLFNGILSLFLRLNENHYENVSVPDINSLKMVNQKIIGINVHLWKISASAIFDQMNSNIAPYRSYSLNFSYTDNLYNRMSTNISGNIMKVINFDTGINNFNSSLSGYVNYQLLNWILLNFEGNYRYNNFASNIYLQYLYLKFDLKINYYNTLITLGYNFYYTGYPGTSSNYRGLNLKLERAFGY